MVDQEIRQDVEAVNARRPGGKFRVALVDPREIKLLGKNARYMTREQFANLVSNIKNDGDLSSVPFCVKRQDGTYHVLSGNHRVKAAVAAELSEILILYTDEELGREREVAIQLAHNAITGQDDVSMLRELWSEIQDLSLKVYSGLDDKALGNVENLGGSGLSPVRLDFRTVALLMLPEEEQRLAACLDMALQQTGSADSVYVGCLGDFERLLKALGKVQKAHNVKNAAVALSIILDHFEATWVPPNSDEEGAEQEQDAGAAEGR